VAFIDWYYRIAFRLNRKWAEQNSPEAQYNLGILYAMGRGVPQDYAEAAECYRKAADQGHPFARTNLGMLYDSGQGVPQDPVRGYMWFEIAASASAQEEIRKYAESLRDKIASRMTPDQIAEAKRLALEWKPAQTS